MFHSKKDQCHGKNGPVAELKKRENQLLSMARITDDAMSEFEVISTMLAIFRWRTFHS